MIVEVTSAFEDEERQRELYRQAHEWFTEARLTVKESERKRWDELYANYESSRHQRMSPGKMKAREDYYRMLRKNVIERAIPKCWGTDEEPRGMRNPRAVCKVLCPGLNLGGRTDTELFESLCAADLTLPEYEPTDEEGDGASFDMLVPSTWSAGIATAILCPRGEPGQWCAKWQAIYRAILLREALAQKGG